MSAVKLPHAIEEKLGELAQKVRKLWLYRGVSWFVLVLLGTAFGLIVLDANYELPGWGRGLLLLGWIVLQVLAFRRLVLRPMRNPIPIAMLAAAIEDQFPNLAERLTTLVELSENAEPGNGSKALIAVLARDTAQRAKKLNFFKAAPTASVVRLALVSLLIAAALLAPLFVLPGAAERVRRFLLPWVNPRSEIGFKVVASSKDIVMKRNDPVTLTGYLERLSPETTLPAIATLIYKDAGNDERKLPMTGDDQSAFTVTRPSIKDSFEYCLEAGGIRSDWHTVIVVDSVELAEGTSLTIRPPKYARQNLEDATQQGLQEFEALQYSSVAFTLKFNRPARSANFEWKPSNPNGQLAAEQFFATLSDDRTAATADWMLLGDGTLKLILIGEQNVRTEIVIATRAVPDSPPKFEKVTGVSDKIRDVRPGERVPIELIVTDDLRVDKLELHFELNGDPSTKRMLPIPLKDIGTTRAEGRYSFDLADKAREGDAIKFRIRAVDHRNVPEYRAAPQEVFFPENGWSSLRIDRSAKPLAEQDTQVKKDKIKETLEGVRREVAEAESAVEDVRKDAAGREQLTPQQIARLDNAKTKEKDAARQLDDLARETSLTPEFRPLANRIKNIEEDPLRQADDQLRKAQNEADAELRDKAIRHASQQLRRAKERLDELNQQVDGFAQNLQDKRKLEEIADKQKELAEELKNNPNNERVAREVAKKQQELNSELSEVLKNNPEMKKAIDELAAERARDLAAEAQQLAEDQKRLDQATKDQTDQARKRSLENVFRQQMALSAKADQLRQETRDEARIAGTEELKKEPFDRANEQIQNGNPVEAMIEQEKAAKDLERLADALEKAAADRRDPKKAAEQFAKLEAELSRKAGENPEPSEELRKQRRKEQEAIRRAVEKLTTPPGHDEAKQAKDQALEKLDRAAKAAEDEPAKAESAMKDASDALSKLAEKLPNRESRMKAAKQELEKLQRAQEAIQRDIQEKAKGLDKRNPDAVARQEAAEKLADAARKQQELAEQLEQLDAPGLENRRGKTADAARKAADDLANGRTQDMAQSQLETRRQMEQLKQALDGQKPNDQRADELAKRQKAIAEEAARSDGKPKPNDLQRLQNQEQELRNELAKMNDPNDAEQLNRAKDAVRRAEEALQRNDAEELKKRTQQAAEELDQLANQLAGAESDQDRAERIAKQQAAMAERAKRQAGKPTSPEQTEAAKEELQRQLDDLKRTRAGEAQQAKKKAADALEKLRNDANPEKALNLQKDAAEATRAFADQIQGKTEEHARKEPGERGNPDAENPMDNADGLLPSRAQAESARQLAKQERELRNELAKANEQGQQGPMATDNAKVEELANKQQQIADQANELAKEAAKQGEAQAAPAKEAAKQAQEAANQMKAGAPERAEAAGERAEQQLQAAAKANGDNASGRKARELAEKQKELNRQAAEQAKDPGANTAQQQKQQGQLAKQAGDLADKLEDAANEPGNGQVDTEKLKKASEKAREAKQQMERARREEEAGRKPNAENARQQAEKALNEAKQQAGDAAGESPMAAKPMGEAKPNGEASGSTKKASKDAKEAEGRMDQASRELGKKQNDQAQKSMEKAAQKLNDAAKQLGQGRVNDTDDANSNAKGQPGGPANPGGNDGSDQSATSKAELPKDLQQYLGKPWGELSGEVKSKIIQDLKAKYGEDYARVIKLYFEQIAERK